MPRGDPARKLAITVDREVHDKVVRAANDEHVSVSAWMTAAAKRALKVREGLAAVAEWESAYGEFSTDELERARTRVVQSLSSPRRPRRRGR